MFVIATPHRWLWTLGILGTLLLGCTLSSPLWASGADAESANIGADIDWWAMTVALCGGLALFLYGMEQMAAALKAAAGERMKDILARLTSNRFLGALTGAFVTAVINSSSITTVLVVGFISAGLLSLSQSVGIIMGANIGSTLTAQLIAFQLDNLALLMLGSGVLLHLTSRNETARQYGGLLLGLGLVFLGMTMMSEAMTPLRAYPPFLDFMATLRQPLLAMLIATIFTGLIQSSAATIGIAIVMASQGFMDLETGIALAFGANIGTCVTALLASIGKPRAAVRAALVHVIFNVAGVLVWIGLIGYLADWVQWLSPARPDLSGAERLAAEVPRQLANAHTLFNIANTLLFIGFTTQLARLVEWLVPERPASAEVERVRPRYLDEELLTTPALALDRVRLELLHMGERVREMMQAIMPAILGGNRQTLYDIEQMDDAVDLLHAEIVRYLGQISRQSLTEPQTHTLLALLAAANDLENIGDLIETNLVELGRARIDQGVSVSEPTREVLLNFHRTVSRALGTALQAVAQNNALAARAVTAMKPEISAIADSAAAHEARRLVAEEPKRIPAYTLEINIIEKLQRIYYFAKRMAKTVETAAASSHPLPASSHQPSVTSEPL